MTTQPWYAFLSPDAASKIQLTVQDPADWKSLGWFAKPGAIIGSDFSGTIAAIGPDLKTKWTIGDRVAGCIQGSFIPGRGAFAEYTRANSDRLCAVPDTLPQEQAAALGIPYYTAAQVCQRSRCHTTLLHALHIETRVLSPQAVLHCQQADFPPAKVPGSPWVR